MNPQTVQLPLHHRVPTRLAQVLSLGLLQRFLVLAVLFVVELLLLSVWLDGSSLIARGGIAGLIGAWGAWTIRGIVGFVVAFLTFGYLSKGAALAAISRQAEPVPVNRGLLAAHLFAMAVFGTLSWALYGGHLIAHSTNLLPSLWFVAGISGIAFAALSLLPLSLWLQLFRDTGSLWILTLALIVAACLLGNYARALWQPAANLTFLLTKSFLSPFVSGVIADPASMTLGTAKFSVIIAPQCSGFEGVGLILAFSTGWLWFFRRECRFPHALLLIPAGVVAIFLLNSIRIAVLILIGNAGAQQIALGGFHSQAGWIAFNAVALGFSVAATRLPWLTRQEHASEPIDAAPSENPTTAYLLPFLTILAVGMLTTAASSEFEWLYPIRFLAAAAVLLALRKRYRTLDWRFSWFGPLIGVAVFVLWITLDQPLRAASGEALPPALAAASSPLRVTWIAFRALAAIVTVPIAEELAFRGFLLRRLAARDFEGLPLSTFTWLGLGISSVAFGLLHGHLWLAGTLAGLLYAWAMIRRGRIGEAVIAHATTNALLACYVLTFHKWHFWS